MGLSFWGLIFHQDYTDLNWIHVSADSLKSEYFLIFLAQNFFLSQQIMTCNLTSLVCIFRYQFRIQLLGKKNNITKINKGLQLWAPYCCTTGSTHLSRILQDLRAWRPWPHSVNQRRIAQLHFCIQLPLYTKKKTDARRLKLECEAAKYGRQLINLNRIPLFGLKLCVEYGGLLIFSLKWEHEMKQQNKSIFFW